MITPRTHSGDHAALSVLLTARNAISTARTASINQLTALLRSHWPGVDARRPVTETQITQIGQWRTHPSDWSDHYAWPE